MRKKVTSEILCLIWHYNSVAIRCLQTSNPIQSKTWGFHGSEDSYQVMCICGAMCPVGRDQCLRGTDSLHVPLKCWYLAPRLHAATTETVFNSASKINKYFWICEWLTNIFSSYLVAILLRKTEIWWNICRKLQKEHSKNGTSVGRFHPFYRPQRPLGWVEV
jgi:hypothetical protein